MSIDPADYIRKKVGKLNLKDISRLTPLIDGQCIRTSGSSYRSDGQNNTEEEIKRLIDPEGSADPQMKGDCLTKLLEENSKFFKSSLQKKNLDIPKFEHFFGTNRAKRNLSPHKNNGSLDKKSESSETETAKPRRILKGLDPDTIKLPVSVKKMVVKLQESLIVDTLINQKVSRNRVMSAPELRVKNTIARLRRSSEVAEETVRHYECFTNKGNTRNIVQMFESNQSLPTSKRSSPVLLTESLCDNIEKQKRLGLKQVPRRASMDQLQDSSRDIHLSCRMQRVSDIIEKRLSDAKRPKAGGRRKAQREIMKQRFEKSLQMLEAEPQLGVPSADLENDYGLQQYRASAPHFGDRVKKLERQLAHYVR